MLLNVEGEHFSSSTSGHSKKGKRIRVSPWNQYQLVEQEDNPEFQLAPSKGRVTRQIASFICFGHASAGVNETSPPKVGSVHDSEASLVSSASSSGKESVTDDSVNGGERKIYLKSSLKKRFTDSSVLAAQAADTNDSLRKVPSGTAGFNGRRRIQWTDACGKELVEIKEFEPSDDDFSDDEFEYEGDGCQCIIL